MSKKYECKYCGIETANADCICGTCRNKLPLVRKLVKMFEPYRKKSEGDSE